MSEIVKQKLPSVSTLFKETFNYYKAAFKSLFTLQLMFIPVGFLGLLGLVGFAAVIVPAFVTIFVPGSIWKFVLVTVGIIIGIVAWYYAFVLMLTTQAAMTKMILDKTTTGSFKELYKGGRLLYKKYLSTIVWVGVMTLLWTLCLIVPGLIFAIYYSFAIWICVDKGKVDKEALQDSKALVTGYWWAVVGRLMLLQILYYVAISIITVILGGHPSVKNDQTYSLVSMLGSFFFVPFGLVYVGEIYRGLKTLKKF